ncbi:MAG: hypothetical protein ACLRMX_01300 [Lachnospira eligens]
MQPLSGNIIMEMASNLGFAIVDRLLEVQVMLWIKREIFQKLNLQFWNVSLQCVNQLQEPWENVVKVNPRLERIETNSQFAQIISPSETPQL